MPFGYRHSLLGHPVPAGELGPPHGRLTEHAQGRARTPTGYPVPHTRAATGMGALYTPGTTVLTPTEATSGRAPAASQRTSPCTPPHIPPTGYRLTRQTRVHAMFARPVFPSPLAARMERAALGLPPGFAPRRPGAGRRTPGWGQAIEHGPGTTRSTHSSISNPVVHSLCATSGQHIWPNAIARPAPSREQKQSRRDQSAHARIRAIGALRIGAGDPLGRACARSISF